MKMIHNEYTSVFPMDHVDDEMISNEYAIFSKYTNTALGLIKFQDGEISEKGLNGISEIDLLTVLKLRAEETTDNEEIIKKINELIELIR